MDAFRKLEPLLPAIRPVCQAEGEDPALVAAILDRESLVGWALHCGRPSRLFGWGDRRVGPAGRARYHAFGGCQADLGVAELVLRGMLPGFDLTTPQGQALWICRHVASSRRLLRASFPGLEPAALEEAAVCAYNASIGGVVAALEEGKDPNLWTTDGDYGRDVLARRDALRRDHPDAFPK